jgi:hypothetical protein
MGPKAHPRRRRDGQQGFALLLVFAMAAAVAIMIFLEMPRIGFERQRDKEDLLVERGEQYVRAIQLYVKKFNKYPQSIDELERSNNIRFLRRRYVDPMTGKDEWRLVHIDGAGQYLDSLVHKKADEKKNTPSILASTIQGVGESATVIQPGGGGPPSAAMQRRASDRLFPGSAPGSVPPQGTDAPPPDNAAGNPDLQAPGDPSGQGTPESVPRSGQAVQQSPFGQNQTNPFQQPGTVPLPGTPAQPGQARPGSPYPAQGVNSQQGGAMGTPIGQQQGFGFGGGFGGNSTQPANQGSAFGQSPFGQGSGTNQGGFGQSGFGQNQGSAFGQGSSFNQGSTFNPGSAGQSGFGPGLSRPGMPNMGGGPAGQSAFGQSAFGQSSPFGQAPMGQGSNQAVEAIRQMMTSPRQGGAPSGVGSSLGGQMAGGIAGVASKYDQEGIKVYNEKTNYKEWEFLYDFKKEQQSQAAAQGAAGSGALAQGKGQGQQGSSGFGQSGFGQSGFGQSGFGQSGSGQSSFGQSGFGQPGSGQSGFGGSNPTRPAPGGFGR